ncbi:branched-chain amino acid ABC transporter permease/ATP-binding protein [Frankia sp. Cppng1_Ct_nod]|uniref:branched-chain amino acid ABC transporter permease/ATP-binding protein n=1 Tax=Frankia sp. Cppng1_Ct_nod TaxID=2897162 RepID=UPI0010418F31|nr:branched-chain amino acid ABC transporter permease/ATP-binding protein [Frankia sp. Cppng1_Ct_nod]
MLPFIIAGLTTGAVYGLAGVGLVLTYKTSGLFNFAHGALATVAAYVFYTLNVQHGVAWPVAALIAVFVSGPVTGLLFERLARAIDGASLALRVASTIGILLIVQTAAVLIYGTAQDRRVPQFLPTDIVRIGGTNVTYAQIITFAIALAATVALYVFFRLSRLGVAMRAVVESPTLLGLAGTNPTRARRWAWCIGVTFAAACGVLLSPLVSLTGTTLTLLVVQAFGAAAIGAFTSLPLTFVGGLVIGVVGSIATKYFTTGVLSGVPASLPFIILFVILLVFPKRWLAERSRVVPRTRASWTTPWQVQVTGGVALLTVLALAPSFADIHLTDWTIFLSLVMLFLSLGLLVRTSGQVSLAHVSFAAIGVAGFSHLAVDHHWPWAPALLVAGLIAVPIGAILAIPAIRLTGLYLALATLGFAILVAQMFYTADFMFGSLGLGLTMPRPHLPGLTLDSDKGFYYLTLALVTITALGVVALDRGRLGRLLRAMADSPTALATSGNSINVTRVLVFCLSAFLAAVAGALGGMAQTTVTGDNYQPLTSLVYLTLIIITVGGEPWYAILAAGGLALVPSYVTNSDTTNWLQILFGVGAVLYAVTPDSARGTPLALANALDRIFRRRPAPSPAPPAPAAAVGSAAAAATVATGRDTHESKPQQRPAERISAKVAACTLEVLGLRVQFGGLVAVDGVGLAASTGRITGLIGPNGAGKTTTFNACSGLNRPTAGRVLLDGRDISHRGPASRARLGLGRTFQQMELFDSLSVRHNVDLGAEGGLAGLNALTHLAATPGETSRIRGATADALALCDLTDLADTPVSSLSTGQRRLVELARCLAGPFRVLLLDEPSSGLDHDETRRFGDILLRIVADRGVGILLVEHDMALVRQICDYIYVLDFGKSIFEGAPAAVLAAPVVRAAYLGDDLGRAAPGENPAVLGAAAGPVPVADPASKGSAISPIRSDA